tara:strand:+ start:516 stop:1007 length:492 start_codon:yes stop_codon:yes gene_type:complete
MGSDSDLPTMQGAVDILEEFGLETEVCILSAHRTPIEMVEYAKNAESNNIKVIIAGAGGSAHLPGMVAALTIIPVIGVPVQSKTLKGIDSLLSIVQMPAGVPVATVAINGGRNAGLLASQIVGLWDLNIREKLNLYRQNINNEVRLKNDNLRIKGIKEYLKTK